MPEGHKTHFIARQHSAEFAGKKVQVTSPQGRFRTDARKVSGKVLDRVEAAGKHMFYHFDGGAIIHIHLGRYGKFRELPTPPPPPVGQVRMRLKSLPSESRPDADESFAIDLTGPSTCRVIDQEIREQVVAKLGPDPLAGGKKSEVWQSFSSSNKPIGGLLLDQTLVAGVGNIFRAEVLFETGLDPEIAGKDLSKESFDTMWKSLTKMMRVGLKYGKIISVTSREAGMPLAKVDGKDRFRVYGKTDCPRCDGPIQTIEVAARKLYVCPHCQNKRN